jgi:tetratricopeptide (TPR) repeat protein
MRVWFRRVRSAFDDLRAVLERSLEQGEPETGLRLLIALQIFLTQTGVREAGYWLDQLLSAGDIAPEILAPALSLRGGLLTLQGDTEAAVAALERSLDLFETVDDPPGRAGAQQVLAITLWGPSEAERVRQLLTSALETFEAIRGPGTGYREMACLFILALWELQFGEPSDAERFAPRLERLGEQSGGALIKAHASELSGLTAHFADDQEQAQARFVEAVGHYRQAGFPLLCFAHCLDHIALWALNEGRPDRAATLLGSVEALRKVATAIPPFERIWHDQATTAARDQLGAPTFERHFQEGRQTEPQEAAELASATLLGERTGSTTDT